MLEKKKKNQDRKHGATVCLMDAGVPVQHLWGGPGLLAAGYHFGGPHLQVSAGAVQTQQHVT
jgi:hypothetical protein